MKALVCGIGYGREAFPKTSKVSVVLNYLWEEWISKNLVHVAVILYTTRIAALWRPKKSGLGGNNNPGVLIEISSNRFNNIMLGAMWGETWVSIKVCNPILKLYCTCTKVSAIFVFIMFNNSSVNCVAISNVSSVWCPLFWSVAGRIVI